MAQGDLPQERYIVADLGRLHTQMGCLYAIEGRRREALARYRRGIEYFRQIEANEDVDTGLLPIQIAEQVVYLLARERMLDELVEELKLLSGKMVKSHPLAIHQLERSQTPINCQVLYIANSESEHYDNILTSVHSEPVLTISELPHFSRSGGIIELYRDKGRIRFIINLKSARTAGLVISSRLLKLAEVIEHEEAP